MAETLKEKTARGLFWGLMNNGAMQIIGLVFGIILGRLLSPSDYGMIAMITVFSLVASALQNSGFSTALVNLKEPTDNDYNSVFWFNIIAGVSIYMILFLGAPLIASYYHEPRLIPLCRYAFLSIIFASFSTAQSAYLTKHLMVKQRAKSNITATLVSSIVGVFLAWKGFSYWALATQTLVFIGLNCLLFWHYSHWRPTFNIDFGPVKSMFRFSVKIMATTITTQVNSNILNILLGHYFSAHDTGNYNQASQWNTKAFNLIIGMTDSVIQPVLVALRDDNERGLNALRKMMRFASFLAFPLLFGFGLVAKEFIILAIGEKWIASATLLQILCISGAFMPVYSVLTNLIVSRGQSGTFFWGNFSLGIVEIITMLLIWPLGIKVMVFSYVALNLIWLFIWHHLVNKLIGYNISWFLKDTIPFAIAALAVMVATHFITVSITNLWILLISRIIIAAVLYYIVMRVAGAQILVECMGYLKKKK